MKFPSSFYYRVSVGVFAMCAALSQGAFAQERAAGGTTETQMTWSALKSAVDTARTESKAAHDRIDQIELCNKKSMDYAPKVTGADADGCIDNKLITNLTTRITNVEACNALKMLYAPKDASANAKGCVAPDVPAAVQMGSVEDVTAFSARTFTIKFAKAFTKVPKVHVALSSYYYHDNCREDRFKADAFATNITKTGFKLTMHGSGTCGGEARVERAVWMAVE